MSNPQPGRRAWSKGNSKQTCLKTATDYSRTCNQLPLPQPLDRPVRRTDIHFISPCFRDPFHGHTPPEALTYPDGPPDAEASGLCGEERVGLGGRLLSGLLGDFLGSLRHTKCMSGDNMCENKTVRGAMCAYSTKSHDLCLLVPPRLFSCHSHCFQPSFPI